MPTVLQPAIREYRSGEVVEPGLYMDVDTGSVVQVFEREELPEEIRLERYARRFRRLGTLRNETTETER